MTELVELWHSNDPGLWEKALDRYWALIRPANLELEQAMEKLDLDRIRALDRQAWYDFLHDEYFRWKYTAANRYATTTRSLQQYLDKGKLSELFRIKESLLQFDSKNLAEGLAIASQIKGLGTAGASGLLALMYPQIFATVDQFVVKALRTIGGLPEAAMLSEMNPMSLTTQDGVTLIRIMARKAKENNRAFGATDWTARKIDKVLWTYGR